MPGVYVSQGNLSLKRNLPFETEYLHSLLNIQVFFMFNKVLQVTNTKVLSAGAVTRHLWLHPVIQP